MNTRYIAWFFLTMLFFSCKTIAEPKSVRLYHYQEEQEVFEEQPLSFDIFEVEVLQKKRLHLLGIMFELERTGDVPGSVFVEPEVVIFQVTAGTFQKYQVGDVLSKYSLVFTSLHTEGAKETYRARVTEKRMSEEYRVYLQNNRWQLVSSEKFYEVVSSIPWSGRLCIFAEDEDERLWQLLSSWLRKDSIGQGEPLPRYILSVSAEHKKLARFWKRHIADAPTVLSFQFDVDREVYESVARVGQTLFTFPINDPSLSVTAVVKEQSFSKSFLLMKAQDGTSFLLSRTHSRKASFQELHDICLRVLP